MNLKNLLFVIAALFVSINAGAQAKIVTSDYNRNSVSFIAVQRGDSYDSDIDAAVRAFNPGQKFDINTIATKAFRIAKRRSISTESLQSDYMIPESEIASSLQNESVGRQILSFLFGRDADGVMNDKLIRYRGNYDAKDQDVINARASRVGIEALGDAGQALINHSYVVVADPYLIYKTTNDKGEVTWHARVKGYTYQLGITPEQLNDFYEQCWIYEDDDDAAKDAKRKAFREFETEMVPAATVSSSGSSSTVRGAVSSALSDLMYNLESNVSDWEVAVTVSATKPIRAKIGTKEGLNNRDRYRAYSYKEDNNGNLRSVPRGYLRATEIADNSGMISTGESATSKFYQISGLVNIDEGWTIKQSNDLGLGAMLGLKFGGLCGSSLVLDVDMLVKVNTNGTMSYVLGTGAFDLRSTGSFNTFFGLGYGYAVHLTRFFELMPYLLVADDYMSRSTSGSDSDMTFLMKSALVFEPGVRLAANVAYPLQVYAKVCADWLALQGEYYKYYNNQAGHKTGIGVQFGAKWTF